MRNKTHSTKNFEKQQPKLKSTQNTHTHTRRINCEYGLKMVGNLHKLHWINGNSSVFLVWICVKLIVTEKVALVFEIISKGRRKVAEGFCY